MSNNTILATAPLTTTGFHIKATGTTLGNSLIWDNGTNVGIGNTNTSYTLDVSGTGRFTGALTLDVGANTIRSGNDLRFNRADNAIYTQLYDAGSGAANGFILNNTNGEGFHFKNAATTIMRMNSAGNVGIGTTSLTGYTLRLNKNITGSANPTGFSAGGTIQTDATGVVVLIGTSLQTVASANSSAVYHYNTGLGSIGAGTVIGNLYGYVASGLTQGTNNFGFYGNMAAAANTYNLYMNGTANNYMAGSLGIGGTALTNRSLYISKNITGGTDSVGISQDGVIQSDATSSARYNDTFARIQNTAFTLGNLFHYRAGSNTFGSATVTNQYSFYVDATAIGATNNYGFFGNIASGTNRWNLYMAGTAANYMAGQVGIGATSINASAKVQIDSTTQGFLPPRMTSAQRTAIGTPATGLIVYQTDGTEGVYVYTSIGWKSLTMV